MALDRDKINQAAQKFVDKKKYDKAVLEYQRLVQADPNDARTLLKIGDLQVKMGAHAEAVVTYETVGKLYAQQGFALKAIAVYKQIRELIARYAPQLEERYGHITPKLAGLYKQLGLISDALAALDEVATKFQNQGRDREAVAVFEKIVELEPNNPLPHLRVAEAFSRLGDVDGAVREFGIAAEQLNQLGRREDAIKVLERSLHHRSDENQSRACAELYVARGTREDGLKALAKLQACFQANPKNLTTLGLLARAFNLIGQAQKGIEVQKEIARIARDTGDQDKFHEVTRGLVLLAPNDEVVKRLATQAGLIPEPTARDPREATAAAHASTAGAARAQQSPMQVPPPASAKASPPVAMPAPASALAPVPVAASWVAAPAPAYQASPYVQNARAEHVPSAVKASPFAEPEEYDEVEPEEFEDAADMEPSAELEEVPTSERAPVQHVPQRRLETREPSARPPAHATPAHATPARAQVPAGGRVQVPPAPLSSQRGLPRPVESTSVEQLLSDAEAFRRVKLYDRALSSVRKALELAPLRVEVLEAERDILVEADRTPDAIETMFRIAGALVDQLDAERAAHSLQDVLAYEPRNARALAMLHELGYEVVEDESERAPYPSSETQAASVVATSPQRHGGIAELSDPFDLPQARAPLPSFPLADVEVAAAEPMYSRPPAAEQRSIRARALELDDALEEIEFFLNRGLLEDARLILQEQLGVHPNHPLLLEHLQELEIQEQAEAAQTAAAGPRARPLSDHVYDLENSLEELHSWVPAPQSEPQEQVDIEELFSQFKEGVAKQISIDDSQSHYDLGLAYKEMGYLDDAVREFEVAARDQTKRAVCQAMIGSVEISRGKMDEGLSAFIAGLDAEVINSQQETMLSYEVGLLYENRHDAADALRHYIRVQDLSPGYRDVGERISAMKQTLGSMRAAAANPGEDWDAAFDDIIQKN